MATGKILGEKPKPLVSAKFVHYVGTANVREIDTASWDHVGVTDHEPRVWQKANGWGIPVDQFTDDALAWLETQREFVIKDVEVPRAD